MYEHIPSVFFGAAVSAFITIWLYSRDKKTQQQQPDEKKDQDTDNYTCVLTDEDNKFVAVVEKSCLDCKHCYLHASVFMACNYFTLAAPNKKDGWISCNAARQIYKICGREAKHFQPKEIKEIKGNTAK